MKLALAMDYHSLPSAFTMTRLDDLKCICPSEDIVVPADVMGLLQFCATPQT